MKLIGKGAFTRAYLMADGATVKLVTNDPCKECIAINMGSDSPLFPKIKWEAYEGNLNVYLMKYYPKVKSLKDSLSKRDYLLYQLLRKVSNAYCRIDDYNLQNFIFSVFEILPEEFAEEKAALEEHANGLSNYGHDMRFEISPRNVAVDSGKLILLDCFFKLSELRKQREF